MDRVYILVAEFRGEVVEILHTAYTLHEIQKWIRDNGSWVPSEQGIVVETWVNGEFSEGEVLREPEDTTTYVSVHFPAHYLLGIPCVLIVGALLSVIF